MTYPNIEFIPACEFTAEMGDIEIHLLGYYLDMDNAKLQEELAKFQTVRQQRIETMTARLNALGIPPYDIVRVANDQCEQVFLLAGDRENHSQ